MTTLFRKQIEYPQEIHEKLVDLLSLDIARTKAQKSLNDLIVEILRNYIESSDVTLKEARRIHAADTMEKAETIIQSPYLTEQMVLHWVSSLERLKNHNDEELNTQLDALIARFKQKRVR